MTSTAPILAVGALAATYAAAQLIQPLNQAWLRKVCKATASVALSYDDGPGMSMTPRVLDLLAANGARATFFTVGQRVDAAPDVVRRIVREGHEVASHSQWHLHAWKSSPWRAYRDVAAGFDALGRVGLAPRLFRPPFGKVTLSGYLAAHRRGALVVWWTIDSGDTHPALPTPDSVASQVIRGGGGVVLMHDFDRLPERASYVLRCTECILQAAREHDLKIVGLSELLGRAK